MNDYEDIDPQVARYLRALPEPEPPAGLWLRIETQRRQRRRTQRMRWAAAASLAAAVALAALVGRTDAPPAPAFAATPAPPPAEPAGLADVRALDRLLQAAYERGADEAAVQPLWEARSRALAELTAEPGSVPTISVL